MSAENKNSMDETIVSETPLPADGVREERMSKLPLIALVCGALALLIAVGGLVFVQMGKAGHDEVKALRSELKKRDASLTEMHNRIETLIGEVAKLTEAEAQRAEAAVQAEKAAAEAAEAEARKAAEAAEAAAKAAAEKESKEKGKAKPGAAVPPASPAAPAAPVPKSGAAQPVPVATAPVKSGGQGCDLVGKSPEEQAAILKRCVSLIDPPAKPR